MRQIPHLIAVICITFFGSMGLIPIITIAFPNEVKAVSDILALFMACALIVGVPSIIIGVIVATVTKLVKGS